MKTLMVALAAAGFLVAPVSINSLSAQQTDPQPTCRMCEGTYLPATEIQDYLKKALAEKRTDQQARDVDIGRAHIGIGVVHRGKLDTRSLSMIWSARCITSCRDPARWCWVRISPR